MYQLTSSFRALSFPPFSILIDTLFCVLCWQHCWACWTVGLLGGILCCVLCLLSAVLRPAAAAAACFIYLSTSIYILIPTYTIGRPAAADALLMHALIPLSLSLYRHLPLDYIHSKKIHRHGCHSHSAAASSAFYLNLTVFPRFFYSPRD
jgi:hypothetical protein